MAASCLFVSPPTLSHGVWGFQEIEMGGGKIP